MNNSENKRAIWVPNWHAMDQSLRLGQRGKFGFFQHAPDGFSVSESFDLIFFNRDDSLDCVYRTADVVAIYHKDLGDLSEIDARGLDYVFTCSDGKKITVDAEEEPGTSQRGAPHVNDWSVTVTLGNVSEAICKLD